VVSCGFDGDGRLTGLSHGRGWVVLVSYGFVYDEADRITRLTSADRVSDYAYDLTNHGGRADEAYAYDANGNAKEFN
jgi:YD repeat-containing protein